MTRIDWLFLGTVALILLLIGFVVVGALVVSGVFA